VARDVDASVIGSIRIRIRGAGWTNSAREIEVIAVTR